MNGFPRTPQSFWWMEHGQTGLVGTKIILPLQREGLKVTCAPIPLTNGREDPLELRGP